MTRAATGSTRVAQRVLVASRDGTARSSQPSPDRRPNPRRSDSEGLGHRPGPVGLDDRDRLDADLVEDVGRLDDVADRLGRREEDTVTVRPLDHDVGEPAQRGMRPVADHEPGAGGRADAGDPALVPLADRGPGGHEVRSGSPARWSACSTTSAIAAYPRSLGWNESGREQPAPRAWSLAAHVGHGDASGRRSVAKEGVDATSLAMRVGQVHDDGAVGQPVEHRGEPVREAVPVPRGHDVVGPDDHRHEGRRTGRPHRGVERRQLRVEDVLDAGPGDREVEDAMRPPAATEPRRQLTDPAAVERGRADALAHRVAEGDPERAGRRRAPPGSSGAHAAAYGSVCAWTSRIPGNTRPSTCTTGPGGRGPRSASASSMITRPRPRRLRRPWPGRVAAPRR